MKNEYMLSKKIFLNKGLWLMIFIELAFVGLTFYSEQSIDGDFFNNFMRGYGSSNYAMRYLLPCFCGYISLSLYKLNININKKRDIINIITFNNLIIILPMLIYIISITILCLIHSNSSEISPPPIFGPFYTIARDQPILFIIILMIHYIFTINLLVFFGLSLCNLLKEKDSIFVLILILLICNIRDFLPSFFTNNLISSFLPYYPTDIVYYEKSFFKYIYDIGLFIILSLVFFKSQKIAKKTT
jgi:hypothetical protein